MQVAKLCMWYVNFELCERKGNIVEVWPPYRGVEVRKLARKKGGSKYWGFVTLLSRVLKVRSVYLKRKVEKWETSASGGDTRS